MHERMERFRRRVERHFGGRPGRGARYPEELRAEAVELARAAVEAGVSPIALMEPPMIGIKEPLGGAW